MEEGFGMSLKVQQVIIHTDAIVGKGTKDDPVCNTYHIYDMEGNLLFCIDPRNIEPNTYVRETD